MAEIKQQNGNAFDFSQNALEFKARLWKTLKTKMALTSVQELDDDDLEWVNAAGMPVNPDDERV